VEDALPPTLAGLILGLDRRIAILERSNKLLSSTIVGGILRVLDISSNPVVLLGDLPTSLFDPVTTNGLRVYSSGGTSAAPMLSVNQLNGLAFPWLSTEWKSTTDSVVVTSGTFATQWTSTTELIFAKEILFRVRLVVDAATTAEAKVLVTAVDGTGGGQMGNTLSLSAATDAVREFRFGHSQTLGGGPLMFSLQTRRVSGAGNVTVYHPHPLHHGGTSAVTGGWV
jgi:hypothetical protein